MQRLPRRESARVRSPRLALVALVALCACAGCRPDDEAQAREVPAAGVEAASAAAATAPTSAPAGRSAAPGPRSAAAVDVLGDEPPEARPAAHLAPRFEVLEGPRQRGRIALAPPPPGKKGAPLPPEPVRDVLDVVQPAPGHLVAVLRPGDVLIETTDAGESWTSWRTELDLVQLAVEGERTWYGLSDVDPDGRAHRVARSQDRGRTWELRVTGRKMDPDHPAKLVDHRGELILAVGRHLLRSKDGKKWVWDNPGLPELARITALSLGGDGGKRARLLLGSSTGQVALRDGEGQWQTEALAQQTGQPLEVHGVAHAPGDLARRFAATSAGLFARGADGAWQRVESLGARAWHGVVLGDAGVGLAFGAAGEVAGTIDGGTTWVRYTDEVLASLGLDRADPQHALAVLDVSWRSAQVVEGGFLLFGDELTIVRVATAP